MRIKVALAVAGASLLAIALIGSIFFSFAGWPKWVLVFVGAFMAMPLWDVFAGTPIHHEESKPFRGFDETNIGDPMQDGWGFNGQSNDK